MTVLINPCEDVSAESAPAVQAPVAGQQTSAVVSPATEEPREESQNFFPHESIDQSAFSADRNVSLVNEEYFLKFPVSEPPNRIRTTSQIIREKRAFLSEVNLDYFRANDLSMWAHSGEADFFINGFKNELKRRRDLGIPFNTIMGNTRLDDNGGLSSVTMFDIELDAAWTKINTLDFKLFKNSAGVFFDVYLHGQRSMFYDETDHKEYRYGLINPGTFADTVFENSLALSAAEAGLLFSPGFNTANILLSNNRISYFDNKRNEILDELLAPSLYKKYFDRLSSVGIANENSLIVDGAPATPISSTRIQKFPSDKVEGFDNANSILKTMIANSATITINTKQDNTIAQFLKDNKMDRHLLDYITSDDFETNFYTQVNDEAIYYNDSRTDQKTMNDAFRSGIPTKVWKNFKERIEALSNPGQGASSNIEEYPLAYHNHDSPRLLSFEDAITSRLFLRKLEGHIKQNSLFRTYDQILSGVKAHSETVAYHVVKLDADTGETIQDFYFSDSDQVSEINFIDTQVIFNKKYRYRVNAVNFVVATEYSYTPPSPWASPSSPAAPTATTGTEPAERYSRIIAIIYDASGKAIQAKVEMPDGTIAIVEYTEEEQRDLSEEARDEANDPEQSGLVDPLPAATKRKITVSSNTKFYIIESPFFEKEIYVYDKPPIFPQVSFLPYKGLDNQVGILLQANTGEFIEQVVKIKSSDTEKHDLMVANQAKTLTDPITFGTDTLPTRFEALVIDYEPTSYSDFSSANSILIDAHGQTGFVLFRIEPNKNYYYIFRSHDDGGLSNPTEVYRAQMVSYQNGIFLDMEMIEMRKEVRSDPIVFEKNLKIEPAFKQKLLKFKDIDFDNTTPEKMRDFFSTAPDAAGFKIGDDIEIDASTGEDRKKIWNKSFKLRLKSKYTGKKIDIKIKFKNTKKVLSQPPPVP